MQVQPERAPDSIFLDTPAHLSERVGRIRAAECELPRNLTFIGIDPQKPQVYTGKPEVHERLAPVKNYFRSRRGRSESEGEVRRPKCRF